MKKIKVWIVDDENDLGELFIDFFSSESIDIEYYDSPLKALAETSYPDVFFIDYRMPQMDGDLLAQKLPNHIPKFLITGELEVTPQYKFNGIIVKPYDLKTIKEIFNQIQSN